MAEEPEDHASREAVGDASAALGASGVGTAVSAAVGPAGALAGPALLLGRSLRQRSKQKRELSEQGVLERAAEIIGGLNVLEERTSHDDERFELVARVLDAARTTTLDAKIRALARTLADGLQMGVDGAVDDAMVLAAALHDIDNAHAVLLKHLEQLPTPPDDVRRDTQVDSPGWEVGEIKDALPTIGVVDALVATLSRHGLLVTVGGGVTYPGGSGPPIWRVSDLGRRCLLLLSERPPETAH